MHTPNTAQDSHLLCFRTITKLYQGVCALDAVDFSLEKGEIHCLVGENGSGKSTLIKIISGVVLPEPGAKMRLAGQDMYTMDTHALLQAGVRVIYQDLALFPNLTVKENIAFGIHSDSPGSFVNWAMLADRAREAMQLIGLELDIERNISSLSIAEQQQVEIARALTGNLQLLILDEPTASLTRSEVEKLFSTIRILQKKGITTLFVSHKLNEIFEIAERVTVLRDGKNIGIFSPAELSHEKLIYLMTGESFSSHPPDPLSMSTKEMLRVEHLSLERNYKDVSFVLKEGEILGITGRLGSGRTELALSLFGMHPAESGAIFLSGSPLKIKNNATAIKAGIAYVPENRLLQGLVMSQSISSNMSITVLPQLLNKVGLLDADKTEKLGRTWVEKFSIKISNLMAAVKTLSGGNQQKVVLSKWLARNPKILILDEPTVGIDVFAKNSVHTFIKDLAAGGMSILLISDEVQEVLSNCHRVLVMDGGRIVDEVFPGPEAETQLFERFNLA